MADAGNVLGELEKMLAEKLGQMTRRLVRLERLLNRVAVQQRRKRHDADSGKDSETVTLYFDPKSGKFLGADPPSAPTYAHEVFSFDLSGADSCDVYFFDVDGKPIDPPFQHLHTNPVSITGGAFTDFVKGNGHHDYVYCAAPTGQKCTARVKDDGSDPEIIIEDELLRQERG